MSYRHITKDQRVELGGLLRAELKQKDISLILGKSESSISRELTRNQAPNLSGYDARKACLKTMERRIKANQRFRKIENDLKLKQYIHRKLKKYWSPEQIAGRLKKTYGKTLICHETIYRYVYDQAPELKKYLRSQKGKYRRRAGTKQREIIRESLKKRHISTRPKEADERTELGHYEGDTILDQNQKNAIATIVDRLSIYLLAQKLNHKTALEMRLAAKTSFDTVPQHKKKTLTLDNGAENSDYEYMEKDNNLTIYFATPYHSWERPTNENTNGLLRQFFPKNSSFELVTNQQLQKVVSLINNRPRKSLNYFTPHEVFRKNCALD
jgi:transposase, IS30 family